MNIKLTRGDAASHWESDGDMAGYLEIVLEGHDPELTRIALVNIAKAKGILEIAKQTGIPLDELKRAFFSDLEPNVETVTKLIHAMAPRLHEGAV